MIKDQWGHEVTAAGDAAARALDETLMSYLALGRETGPLLKMRIHPHRPARIKVSGVWHGV